MDTKASTIFSDPPPFFAESQLSAEENSKRAIKRLYHNAFKDQIIIKIGTLAKGETEVKQLR